MQKLIITIFAAIGVITVAVFVVYSVGEKIKSLRFDKTKERNLKILVMDYLEECTGHCKICESYGKCKLQPKGKSVGLWYSYGHKEIEAYCCPHFTGVYYDEETNMNIKCINGEKKRYTYYDKKKGEWI